MRAWKHAQTGCLRERALGTKKQAFSRILWVFWELCTLCQKICVHSLSFHLKLTSVDIFQSCAIKNQRLSRTKNQFQGLSRSWNWTPEIQGFSRVFKMRTSPAINICLLISLQRPTMYTCTGSPYIWLEYEKKINLPLSRVFCVLWWPFWILNVSAVC